VGRIFREFSVTIIGFDFRQRHRFADAHAVDVFRPATGSAEKRAEKNWIEARLSAARKKRVLAGLRAFVVVFPSVIAGFPWRFGWYACLGTG